ncbi:hypothetical protein ACFS2C_18290 [Prauserella oleivorans]|uniref:Uncharacterized protein n=1 Tax=Prauserella oleivorans TaxID=1478153 RepID=A0ABW5WDT7_9PSEU
MAVAVSVPVSMITVGAGTAFAAQPEPNAMTFGLLGPVGLIAIVLGVLGMTAGVLRQRRKARAEAVATQADSRVEVAAESVPVSTLAE